ncbi:NAD(P)-dependent dehydrogenase (short-subunit alcohol dehydrogenase family) [Pullulanibacillus pueri]|uniref:D-mannonate oxidoreductase n=2 Tax=Pullulanibacillus pueri TaxID=1437324 RepID=A0A8J2ZYH0_9BACL|nr:NAD(P)-dependent dehydrogenase (short-subunit alcohol dehydrogenase family) [Pullulanibacillus pueri]GGH86000.1 D-mannonate oxidoreductase [Pullulanibacillus pueri]
MFDLTGKTAVIVGGTSTLGSAMAMGLAKQGATIALVGRNLEKASEVEQKIKTFGVEVRTFQADVTDDRALKSAADEIVAWADSCDILLNAPGVNSTTPFSELTMDEWDHIMNVNLKGVVLSCQIFSKHMIEQGNGGSIINISSVSSTTPLSKVFTYSASKAGINSITQYLAREFAPYNIRVNAVIPGFFPAEQNRKILSEDRVAAIMRHTPMERFGDPEELQGVAIWLASKKASSFVTGELIRVDGGFGAMTI